MSIFDDEILLHNTLKGDVSLESAARPGIKLNTKPRIVICIPVGTKQQARIFKVGEDRYAAPSASVPGVISAQWVAALHRMVPPLGVFLSYLWQWGLLSGEARQIMTTRALEIVQEDGYVLYWDDDILVEPLSLYTLYSFMETHPEAGAVSGVYSTRQDPTEPVVYKEHMKGCHWGLTVGPNAEPEEVFAVGAGFLLVRAKALRDMIANNPDKPVWADSKTISVSDSSLTPNVRFRTTFGHDIRFCALLQEAGWKLYVDGRVELGHFDIIEQKEYRLPDDSPPKMRGRGETAAVKRDANPNTMCLVLPIYGHLDYAEKAARSFLRNTTSKMPVVIAVDDGTPGITTEELEKWASDIGIQHVKRFEDNAGLTRSWNYGLRLARDLGYEYVVAGNSDLIFARGWDAPIVEALKIYDLVGPVTNASGWGTPKQNIAAYMEYEVNDDESTFPSLDLAPQELSGFHIGFSNKEALAVVPEFLNGFCTVARTDSWWAGAFDAENVFDPSHPMTENEVELQMRWVIGAGAKRAVVPSSFVFHYRAVSRGDEYKCPGAFRPEPADGTQ